jgi:CO/xanthine dehydrogenase FAD-binding subunit
VQPASFAYVRAASLDQVLDLLARYDDPARMLARGRSLIAISTCASPLPARATAWRAVGQGMRVPTTMGR